MFPKTERDNSTVKELSDGIYDKQSLNYIWVKYIKTNPIGGF